MAVFIKMLLGGYPELQDRIGSAIEHVLVSHPGEWHVTIVGSQRSDAWEIKISGPDTFQRYYTLEGAFGYHDPEVIERVIARMVP